VLEPDDPDADPSRPAPVAVRVAAAVAGLQGLGLAVFAAVVVGEALRGDRSSVSGALLLVALLAAWAATLVLCARGLLRRRRWARAPLVLSELLLLAVGIPLVQGSGARWVGVLLVVGSVVGLLAVLSPAVTAELER
jgi:hypothetical protein